MYNHTWTMQQFNNTLTHLHTSFITCPLAWDAGTAGQAGLCNVAARAAAVVGRLGAGAEQGEAGNHHPSAVQDRLKLHTI